VDGDWGVALVRCSLFSFAGNLCRAFRDICSTNGGAMAEVEEEQGTALEVVGAEDARSRSEPGKARGGVRRRLKRAAEETVDRNIPTIMLCLMTGIEGNHLPCAKMLLDLAVGPGDEDEDEVSGDGYASLAELLWKELADEEREQATRELGIGNRE
jgi:hypothetical protein